MLAPAPTLVMRLTGATHVDVDGVHAARLQQLCGIAHHDGIAAEQLHGKRSVFRAGFDELQRLGAAVEQPARVDKIRRRQSHTAKFPHNPAERQVCIARQR